MSILFPIKQNKELQKHLRLLMKENETLAEKLERAECRINELEFEIEESDKTIDKILLERRK